MMLGAEGSRELLVRAEAMLSGVDGWHPTRADRAVVAALRDADGAATDRDVIVETLSTLGVRHVDRMSPALVRLLLDAAAVQDLPSIAELPESQAALRAVDDLLRVGGM